MNKLLPLIVIGAFIAMYWFDVWSRIPSSVAWWIVLAFILIFLVSFSEPKVIIKMRSD